MQLAVSASQVAPCCDHEDGHVGQVEEHKDGVNDHYYGCDGAGYKYSGRGCCGEGIGEVLLIVMSIV